MNTPLLRVNIERCGYKGGFELRDIHFELDRGELLLVTGPSGSGKTTLARALTGTLVAVNGFIEGEILLDDRDITRMKPEELVASISYIPQEPWYAIIGYSVYSEICYSLSLLGTPCSDVDFMTLGISSLINRLTYTLSAGETQRVLWLEAILTRARLLVLDEPLVYLDKTARNIVKHYIERSLSEGEASAIIIDHNPYTWRDLESEIKLLIIRDGRVVYYGKWREDILPPPVIIEKNPKTQESKKLQSQSVVEFKSVWFKYPGGKYIVENFNQGFERGSLTLLKGPNGSGKTTILKLATGILKPSKGSVKIHGRVVYIPENPLLYFTMPTPREELLVASNGDENKVLDMAEAFGLKKVLDIPLARLSSGERRRVSIASAYLLGFDGYFIDEPTGGLDDISAKSVIESLITLVDTGKCVVIASHDERLDRVSDRIIPTPIREHKVETGE